MHAYIHYDNKDFVRINILFFKTAHEAKIQMAAKERFKDFSDKEQVGGEELLNCSSIYCLHCLVVKTQTQK